MQKHQAGDSKACTQRQYNITAADLPLSCPPSNQQVWDAHPRVYLPIEDMGSIVCPYCNTKYVLST